MVSIESFLELVKKRDIGRIKFAIRETNFDINSKDEVSLKLNHYITCNHGVIYLNLPGGAIYCINFFPERKTALYLLIRYSLAWEHGVNRYLERSYVTKKIMSSTGSWNKALAKRNSNLVIQKTLNKLFTWSRSQQYWVSVANEFLIAAKSLITIKELRNDFKFFGSRF